MLFGVIAIVAFFTETYWLEHHDIAGVAIFWAILAQACAASFAVARTDSTWGGGYLFAVILAVAALAFFLGSNPPLVREAIFFGIACVATMATTYRVRRLRNHRRALGY